MGDAPQALMRPLSIGEILDRSVTLFVRNAVPFLSISLCLILPVQLLQLALRVGSLAYRAMAFSMVTGRPFPTTENIPTPLVTFGAVCSGLVLAPFAYVAIAAAVGRIYQGHAAGWRSCLYAAATRWRSILGMIVIELSLFAIVLVGEVTVFGAILRALVSIRLSQSPLAATAQTLLLPAAYAMIGVSVLMLAMLYVPTLIGFLTVGIEDLVVPDAISLAFVRCWNRAEFGRTALFALSLAAALCAMSAIEYACGFAAAWANLIGIVPFTNAAAEVLRVPVFATIMAVFYFDLRVRREAYDIEATLTAMESATV